MAKKKNKLNGMLLVGIALGAIALALFALPFIKMTVLGKSTSGSGFGLAFGTFTFLGGNEAVAKATLSGSLDGVLATAYGVSKGLTTVVAIVLFLTFILLTIALVFALFHAIGVLKGARVTAMLAAISVLLMLIAVALTFVLVGKIKKDVGVETATMIYIPFIVNLLASAVLAKGLRK